MPNDVRIVHAIRRNGVVVRAGNKQGRPADRVVCARLVRSIKRAACVSNKISTTVHYLLAHRFRFFFDDGYSVSMKEK
jgi:hypothetical protein